MRWKKKHTCRVEEGEELEVVLMSWRRRCRWWLLLLVMLPSTSTTFSTKRVVSWCLRKPWWLCSKFKPNGNCIPPLLKFVVDPNCNTWSSTTIPLLLLLLLFLPYPLSGTAKICSKKSSPNPSELQLPAITPNFIDSNALIFTHFFSSVSIGYKFNHQKRKTRKHGWNLGASLPDNVFDL